MGLSQTIQGIQVMGIHADLKAGSSLKASSVMVQVEGTKGSEFGVDLERSSQAQPALVGRGETGCRLLDGIEWKHGSDLSETR